MRLRNCENWSLLHSTSLTTVNKKKLSFIHIYFELVSHRKLLGYTVTKECTSPRNLTWFTRLFLLVSVGSVDETSWWYCTSVEVVFLTQHQIPCYWYCCVILCLYRARTIDRQGKKMCVWGKLCFFMHQYDFRAVALHSVGSNTSS